MITRSFSGRRFGAGWLLAGLCAALFIAAAPAGAVEMKAGAAQTVITNETPRVMVNGRVSEGVHSDLTARVLVLNDGETRLVFVTYDLNCLDVATPFLRARVKDELGIEPAQLILLATHNHNAPIQIVPENFGYGRRMADTIFDAIHEAIEDEDGPASVKFGFGHTYSLRSVGNAPTDYEVQVLKIERGGEPLAVLFSQPTHPGQATRNRIDTGHPGFAMDMVEEALPGVQAMYATSCGGNQFPVDLQEYWEWLARMNEEGRSIEYIDSQLEERCRAIARELADVVLGIVTGDMQDVTGPLTSRLEIISLPLAEPISEEEAREKLEGVPEDVGFVPYPHEHRATNWLRMLLRYYEKDLPFPTRTTDMVCTDDTYLIHKEDTEFLEKYEHAIHDRFPCIYEEVIVATIGEMPVVAMQGEIVAPIGARIKDAFRADGPIKVFGYMGEHNLYIPTRELVRLDAYQAQTLRIQYASPVGWDPSVEDVMVNGVINMVEAALADIH